MDARYLLPIIILAGCSGETATSSADRDSSARQVSYAEAKREFETEQKKYEKISSLHAAAVERQKQEPDATDPATAAELTASIGKLAARQAEQKKKLDEAKRVKDEAYAKEFPASTDDIEKAFADPIHRK